MKNTITLYNKIYIWNVCTPSGQHTNHLWTCLHAILDGYDSACFHHEGLWTHPLSTHEQHHKIGHANGYHLGVASLSLLAQTS